MLLCKLLYSLFFYYSVFVTFPSLLSWCLFIIQCKTWTFSHPVCNPLTFHPRHLPSYLSTVLTSFSPSLTSFITPHPLVTVQWSPLQSAYSLHIFYLFSPLSIPPLYHSLHPFRPEPFFLSLRLCLSHSIHPFHSLPSHFKKLCPCSLSKALFHPRG